VKIFILLNSIFVFFRNKKGMIAEKTIKIKRRIINIKTVK
jgi:hypothetical protein